MMELVTVAIFGLVLAGILFLSPPKKHSGETQNSIQDPYVMEEDWDEATGGMPVYEDDGDTSYKDSFEKEEF